MKKSTENLLQHSYVNADGVTAIVLDSFVGGKHVKGVGVSKLNPADHNDPSVGDMLAYGRALRTLGRKLIREGYKKSKKISQ